MRDFFKKNYFCFFATIFFSLIFVSCSIFVSPVKPEPNQTPLTRPSSSNQKLILRANVSDDFTGASNSASASRSAIPADLGLSTSKFAAVLYDSTSTDKDTLIEGTVDTSSGSISLSFAFDIDFVGKTGLTFEVYSFSSTETSFTKAKAITAAKVVKLSVAEGATELNLANPLVMLPNSANTTPGGFELIVSLPSDYNLDVSMITPITFGFLCDTQITADPVWDWTVQPDDDVPAGSYEMLLLVTKGTESCTFRKTIIIYPGVTTTVWVEASTPTAKFEITQSEIENKIVAQKCTEFYVLGDDTASTGWYATNGISVVAGTPDGSLLKPFSTMQTAVNKILDLNDGVKTYTIYVDGTVTADGGSGLVVNLKDNITSPVNIKIIGLGSENAVLSAGGAGADIITLKGSETNKIALTLENLKLTGVGTESLPAPEGGAIFSECYSDITLNNCEVSGNYCQWGGALRIGHHTNVIINGGVYKDNHATSNGGVINANGINWDKSGAADELTILITGDAKFLNNVSDGEGGAIYLTNLTKGCVIEDAEFFGNSARKGGVLHIDKGEAAITGCTTDGTNTASERGNAICNGGTLKISGNVKISEDIYLQKVDTDNLRTITIAGRLTGDDVTITPESYTDGIQILIPAESVDGTTLTDTQKQQLIKDNYKKIKVAPQGSTKWGIKLDSTGLLGVLTKDVENIVSVSDAVTAIENATEEITVTVEVGEQQDLTDLAEAIKYASAPVNLKLTLASTSTMTSIGLDEDTYGTFEDIDNLKSIEIPEGITHISTYAFLQAGIISVKLPDSLISIGNGAFNTCYKLELIELPVALKKIGDDAFKKCNLITSVSIPDSVIEIGAGAFEIDDLNSVTINTTDWVAVSYTGTRDVTIDADVLKDASLTSFHRTPDLDTEKNKLSAGGHVQVFANDVSEIIGSINSAPDGTTVDLVLTGNITKIDNMDFYGCTKLKSIVLPVTVKNIVSMAFYGCTNLSEVVIPEGVETIGANAFQDCTSLTEIELPSSINSIGRGAFYGCTNLTTVKVKSTTPPTLEENAFKTGTGIISGLRIKVPNGSDDTYKAENGWKDYAGYISVFY